MLGAEQLSCVSDSAAGSLQLPEVWALHADAADLKCEARLMASLSRTAAYVQSGRPTRLVSVNEYVGCRIILAVDGGIQCNFIPRELPP